MAGTRDRYIDTIRALAIVRVIVYHALGVGWLTILFPSMGIMFALAGSLMAASMTKSGSAVRTVGHRLRRLLLPLWALGAVAFLVMLFHGWPADDATQPTDPKMLFWILPLNAPPSSEWGDFFNGVLWYISTYLWFVLLTPLLLPLFRRFSVLMLGLPFLMLYVLDHHSFGLGDMVLNPARDFCTYLACWLLGFAHHDGMLLRLKWRVVVPLVLAAAAIGGWLTWIGRESSNFDLTTDAMPNAFWSFAFVLLLLRFRPSMAWLARVPWLERLIDLLNARAVTIYLWHNPGISAVGVVLARFGLEAEDTVKGAVLLVLGTFLWTFLATLVFGWVEDIAARRRPSLLPRSRRRSAAVDPPTVRSPAAAAP
ncbi:acyltransferase family protein [Catenulispora rubra]|uniref:acyltransferase family protein n=1 Tax=Catenulispora rubra TaxID=280293 RepID=UPI0018921DF6|nr:acyltransferase [Catenulispora rubra]